MDIKTSNDLDVAKDSVLTAYSVGKDQQWVKKYYDDWVDIYEEHLSEENYHGPAFAAKACSECFPDVKERPNVRILDIAAGTGLVALQLVKKGFQDIDALDPSEIMLGKAKERNIYSKMIQEFLTEKELPIERGTYDCITTSGGMGQGHIPCEALHELIRITKYGGYICLVMREKFLESPQYKDKLEVLMNQLAEEGKWRVVSRTVKPKYVFEEPGVVFKFQVLQNQN